MIFRDPLEGTWVRCVGISKVFRDVMQLADRVALSDCPVLIEGETGTGKELVARRLWAKSRRGDRPFVPVNCAGISETLVESQLFGHVRGAFTGAEQNMLGVIRAADGGTLFLDEVSEIPLSLQPKLLRVLQEGEVMPVGSPLPEKVDTRFFAGTNRNLREMLQEGRFRDDLYYRLNVIRITIPPLRDRPEDVSELLDYFSSVCARRRQRESIVIDNRVRCLLAEYSWPGNVRELAAWVERLYVTGLSPEIVAETLVREASCPTRNLPERVLSLEEAERQAIVRAMEQAGFNQRKASRLLRVHRSTLARKLKQYELS